MQQTNVRRFSFIVLASVFCGCHQPLRANGGLLVSVPLEVRLDTTAAARPVAILTTFANSSRDTVVVSMCNQTLDYLDQKSWEYVDMTPCAGYPSPAWVVPPHDSLVVPIVKYDDRNAQILLRRGPLVSGVYRLGFDTYIRNLRIGHQGAKETLTSNPFRINIGGAASTPDAR